MNKAQLITSMKAAYETARSNTGDDQASLDAFCTEMADAIEAFVLSGVVKYAGNLQAGANPVTAINPALQIGTIE